MQVEVEFKGMDEQVECLNSPLLPEAMAGIVRSETPLLPNPFASVESRKIGTVVAQVL